MVYFVPFGASFKDLRGILGILRSFWGFIGVLRKYLVYSVPFGASFANLTGYFRYTSFLLGLHLVTSGDTWYTPFLLGLHLETSGNTWYTPFLLGLHL